MDLAGKFGKVLEQADNTYKGYVLAGGDKDSELLARLQLLRDESKLPEGAFRADLQTIGYSPDDLIMADNEYVMSAFIEGDDEDSDRRALQTYQGKTRGFTGTDYATYGGIQKLEKNPLSGKLKI
jgi:hypothetical protein